MEVCFKGMQMRQGSLAELQNTAEGYQTGLVWLSKR